MFKLHPLLQIAATLLGVYVLYLGLLRMRVRHFGAKANFPWKRHVRLGSWTIGIWLLGIAGGVGLMFFYFGPHSLGPHGFTGLLAILPLAVLVYFSGSKLSRGGAASRGKLPLAHGVAGICLVLLAVVQSIGGLWQYMNL